MEKILLVEDDPLEARTLSSLLGEEYRTLLCPELSRAPEAARLFSPAAVVISLSSSCGSRDALIRDTAIASAGAPLFVLSSEADPAAVVGCLRSGAFDFLAKPYDLAELRRRLGEVSLPRHSDEGDDVVEGAFRHS